jgi:hypothetical protein
VVSAAQAKIPGSSPAPAATWHDTALQASHVTQPRPSATAGAVVNGVVGGYGQGSTLSFTAPEGERFASRDFTSGSTDVTLTTSNARRIVLQSKGTATGAGTLTFTIRSTNSAITCAADEQVKVSESAGSVGESSAPAATPDETVRVSADNDNFTGAVTFAGLVSGRPVP